VRVVVAPDKFRGTLSAHAAASAIAAPLRAAGHDVVEVPMAAGGEGTLEVLGGANRTTTVTGPLGDPVDAGWRLSARRAVIEMARASGLGLVEERDAVAASTVGTGELIAAAVEAGATHVLVGLGGSATTDGGLGAVQAISTPARLKRVEFLVACDVDTMFLDAAEVFAAQKGASPTQVKFLATRLAGTAEHYRQRFGVDVTHIRGGGAAGGLAGGLHALGAHLVPGFDLIAEETDLYDAVAACDVIITGEGRLDDTSFSGKVVGGVVSLAHKHHKRAFAICGDATESAMSEAARKRLTVVSLLSMFGDESFSQPRQCISRAAEQLLSSLNEE